MPELPEVETIRRGLSRLIVGKVIAGVSHDTPKSFPNASDDVNTFFIGATITAVRRRAKVLLIDLSSGYTLVTHLKMTGQLVFIADENKQMERPQNRETERGVESERAKERESERRTESDRWRDGETARLQERDSEEASDAAQLRSTLSSLRSSEPEVRWGGGHPSDSLIGRLPDKTTRVEIAFQDDSRLFFNDLRKFGWMKLYPTVEVSNIDFMKKVGPEPLDDDFTPGVLQERLQRRKNTSIKAALLDQTVVAGIGNIYADESLWGARIHPATLVRNIPYSIFHILYDEIRYVLTLSIEKGGSTDKNYVNAEGKRGSYLSFARVFRREGLGCPRCGTTIEKTRVAGRGTHLCPQCQIIGHL